MSQFESHWGHKESPWERYRAVGIIVVTFKKIALKGSLHRDRKAGSMTLWLGVIVWSVAALLVTNGARAEEAGECVQRPVSFDGIAPLSYATVTGAAGSKVYLHAQFPADCAANAADACKSPTYVLAADVVAVGKTCGAWAYVQYIGSARVTQSWMVASRLQPWHSTESNPSGMTAGTSAAGTDRRRFRLVAGRRVPVCEAYLQRLNQTRFYRDPPGVPSSPFCGRPESDAVPGFSRLTRVPLAAEEVNSMINPVYNFTHGTTFEDSQPVAEAQGMLNHELFVWRYRPAIDVDNDGTGDDVIVWQGQGAGAGTGGCGEYGVPPTPQVALRQAQLAYVLTPNGKQVDVTRTIALFGHPIQAYSITDAKGRVTTATPHFRPIGTSIGIFKYRHLYYFDSFFDIWGDFADQRRDRPALANNLGVFLRRDGKTRQICEYHTDDQDYPDSRTWEVLP